MANASPACGTNCEGAVKSKEDYTRQWGRRGNSCGNGSSTKWQRDHQRWHGWTKRKGTTITNECCCSKSQVKSTNRATHQRADGREAMATTTPATRTISTEPTSEWEIGPPVYTPPPPSLAPIASASLSLCLFFRLILSRSPLLTRFGLSVLWRHSASVLPCPPRWGKPARTRWLILPLVA